MHPVFLTLVVTLIYFLSAKAVSPLSLVESSSVFAVWPPTGVALAALLLFGQRAWAGIALGALLLNMTLTPFGPSLQIAVTNTLGPVVAAYMIVGYVKSFNLFSSIQSMFLFFFAITVASAITAAGGSAALMMHGYVGSGELFTVFYTWFLGDLIGFLVITPLAVAWKLESLKSFSAGRLGEIAAVALLLAGGGLLFFGPLDLFDPAKYPIEYMFIIPVLWASIRFGALGGSVSVVAAGLIVILGTINQYGPFVREDTNDTLLLLQGYVWFMGVIALFTATILRQKEMMQLSLQKSAEELELAATVFESTAEGLLITDANRKILAANTAASLITGYDKKELSGMVPPLFERMGAGQSITQEVERQDFWRGEIDAKSKSGDPLPLWLHINTVRDTSGRIVNYVILFLDITDRKKAEAAIKEYQRGLEAKVEEELSKRKAQEQILIQQSRLAAMGEMVGMIAHQWRQPLNALGLMVQDMQDAYEFGEMDRHYIDETVKTTMELVQNMSVTIDDFRSFFKTDHEKQHFSTCDTIESLKSVIGASLRNNNIELIVPDADAQPVEIYGYFREYTQVVLNIINNAKDALKRSDSESKWIRIECMKTEEGRSRLVISDNGGGIPGEILEKIYDPYFTTKMQGHGSGIGLYMAKMIIERHMNGTLREENGPEGARFIIEV